LDLHLALVDPTKAKPALDGLKNCLDRAVGLGNYPGLKLINTIVEAGELFGHLPGYDGLFRAACAAARKRNGEATEGRMLFDRALQLIGTGQHAVVLRLMNEA
jgi:predicted RNA polymerase sigma factor